MLAAVDRIVYMSGWTYTDLGLDEMRLNGFSAANGARDLTDGYPHVGIVLTDGQSNSPPATVAAANRAHAADITMFAVGVGSGVLLSELQVIASTPVCQYLMLLTGFTEMDSLTYAIEKGACEGLLAVIVKSWLLYFDNPFIANFESTFYNFYFFSLWQIIERLRKQLYNSKCFAINC